MASRRVFFSAFDFDGLPLPGLTLNFSAPGYYRINNVAVGSPPAISEVGTTGTYSFLATLVPNENLMWRVDLGSNSSSRLAFGDLDYVDCVAPETTDVQAIKNTTDRFTFDPAGRVYANIGENTESAPVVSNFVPAPGTAITDRTPLGFDVTDDSGQFRRIIALVSFSNGQTDVAYDGKSFRGLYSRYSTKSSIPQGVRFTIARDGRWPGTPTLEVIPIDMAGNEGS